MDPRILAATFAMSIAAAVGDVTSAVAVNVAVRSGLIDPGVTILVLVRIASFALVTGIVTGRILGSLRRVR